MEAGVPVALCGLTSPAKTSGKFAPQPVTLPLFAVQPDRREFVLRDTLAAGERAIADAREALSKLKADSASAPEKVREQELIVAAAEAKHEALLATLKVDKIESG